MAAGAVRNGGGAGATRSGNGGWGNEGGARVGARWN
jgi:hypothetical protein